MKVLITGSGGFLASGIVEALLSAGHQVVGTSRGANPFPDSRGFTPLKLDLRHCVTPDDWIPHLADVDAVVNCVGVLRESRQGEFETIHVTVPTALANACLERGISKFIQISALGSDEDGEFVATKHRFDDWLIRSSLNSVVIRPSVVASLDGSYGGTSMLRALATMPGFVPLPGDGEQLIQPILLNDLANLVTVCLTPRVGAGQTIYAVGPDVLSLRTYLSYLRAWLRLPRARTIPIPVGLIRIAATVGGWLGPGPLNPTIVGMLSRGNVAPPGATTSVGDWRATSVIDALANRASYVQDRWHARMYFLVPFIHLVLVLIWVVSGLAGLLSEEIAWRTKLDLMGIPLALQYPLVVATSVLNLVLGVALLFRRAVRAVLILMLISVLAYSVALGLLAPALWLEPLGGLLKNTAVVALLLVALATREGR